MVLRGWREDYGIEKRHRKEKIKFKTKIRKRRMKAKWNIRREE